MSKKIPEGYGVAGAEERRAEEEDGIDRGAYSGTVLYELSPVSTISSQWPMSRGNRGARSTTVPPLLLLVTPNHFRII